MSRTYEFKGKACRLGRHGKVKPGDIITLHEHEVPSIRGNADFEEIEPEEKEEVDPSELPAPRSMESYDLTKIPWTRALGRWLEARTKPILRRIAHAVSDCSGAPITYSQDATRKDIMDYIGTTAREMQWTIKPTAKT